MNEKQQRGVDHRNYADYIDEILREAYQSRWFRNARKNDSDETHVPPPARGGDAQSGRTGRAERE
ncbi:MAG TPA: hypothetical protein VMK05_03965 [Burkholderiales bacterium]|nr:hypothetical protein [Burkholderiales bacterium]